MKYLWVFIGYTLIHWKVIFGQFLMYPMPTLNFELECNYVIRVLIIEF